MELRIIFMIISTFSGSAVRQNPASVQAERGPRPPPTLGRAAGPGAPAAGCRGLSP